MLARHFAFLLASALCFAHGAAHAQENQGLMKMRESEMSDNRARAHFKVGTSLYESGRFPEAAEEWEAAYSLSKRDALLYNIYVAHRDASNLPKAIDALTRYLATNEVDDKQRLNLEARLRSMQASLDAMSQPKVVEPAPSAEPAPAPAPVEPAPVAQSSSEPEEGGSVLPLALVITGGALVAGGLVTGLVTNGKVSDIEKACPNDSCKPGFDLDGKRSDARTFASVTDLLLVTGAVVTTVGVVLFLVDDDSETDSQSAALPWMPSLACASEGCAASVSGMF